MELCEKTGTHIELTDAWVSSHANITYRRCSEGCKGQPGRTLSKGQLSGCRRNEAYAKVRSLLRGLLSTHPERISRARTADSAAMRSAAEMEARPKNTRVKKSPPARF